MDKNRQWIDDLRRQAQGYGRKAPDGLLDDIKREMARRGVMPCSSKRPARKEWGTARVYRLLSVAAAVVVATLLVVTNLPKNNPKQIADILKTEKNNEQQTENAIKKYEDSQTVVSNRKTTSSKTTFSVRNILNNIREGGERLVAAINVQDETAGTATSSSLIAKAEAYGEAPTAETSARSVSPQAPSSQTEKAKHSNYLYGSSSRAMAVTRDSHSGFDISIGYTGMGGNSGRGGNQMYYSALAMDPKILCDYRTEVEGSTQAHHDMPVKLGVSVRYNVNNRWSLQSGVNYSYLSSDIEKSSNIQESMSRQKLHYISVPLSASVSLWHNKTFNVYLTAGGEAAKLVKGKAEVSRTVYGYATTESDEKIHEHKLQYSVFGSAGIEAKASERLSLYAEPGVAHYFNNHSSVVNIYKDKPTQFTVNIGLRINLNK